MSYVRNRVIMVAHWEFFLLSPKVRKRDERTSLFRDYTRENSVSFVRIETSRLSPRRDEITEVSLEFP